MKINLIKYRYRFAKCRRFHPSIKRYFWPAGWQWGFHPSM